MAILDITHLSEPHTSLLNCRFCSYKYIGVIHHFVKIQWTPFGPSLVSRTIGASRPWHTRALTGLFRSTHTLDAKTPILHMRAYTRTDVRTYSVQCSDKNSFCNCTSNRRSQVLPGLPELAPSRFFAKSVYLLCNAVVNSNWLPCIH